MPTNREFALYPQTRTSIPVLGQTSVDGYFREEHRVGLEKTLFPVESGASLTDNAVSRPQRLRLEGLVSDLLPAQGNSLSPDRATNTWAEIVALTKARTTFDVVTPIRVYTNMLIVRAEVPRSVRTGKALRFILELEELILETTQGTGIFEDQVMGPAVDRTSTVDGGDRTSPPVSVSESTRDYVQQAVLVSKPLPGTATAQFMPVFLQPAPAPNVPGVGELQGQQVPLFRAARESFRTILDGQSVRVTKWYQPTDQSWYMSLNDVDEVRTPIATGIRLVEHGVPLAAQDLKFRGQLLVDGVGDVGRGSWGSTHNLLYLPERVLNG